MFTVSAALYFHNFRMAPKGKAVKRLVKRLRSAAPKRSAKDKDMLANDTEDSAGQPPSEGPNALPSMSEMQQQLLATQQQVATLTQMMTQQAAAQLHMPGSMPNVQVQADPVIPPTMSHIPLQPPSVEGAMGLMFGENPLDKFLKLGSTLDSKICSKIQAGQFVELTSLSNDEDTVPIDYDPVTKQLTMSKKTPKKISNVFEWFRLFGTYASVYLAAHPDEGSCIVTYMVRIMDMSGQYQGGVYLKYDTMFRKLKAKNVALPWHQVVTSILMDCIQGRAPLSKPPVHKSPFLGSTGGNPCYDYNNRSGCSRPRCKFIHKCQTCKRKGHPKYNCLTSLARCVHRQLSGHGLNKIIRLGK